MTSQVVTQTSNCIKSPVMKNGDRNHYCPYYSECLDFAVEKGWEMWSCITCNLKDINVIDIMRKIEQGKLRMFNQPWMKRLIQELKPYF